MSAGHVPAPGFDGRSVWRRARLPHVSQGRAVVFQAVWPGECFQQMRRDHLLEGRVSRCPERLSRLAKTVSRGKRRTEARLSAAAPGRLVHAGTRRCATRTDPCARRTCGGLVRMILTKRRLILLTVVAAGGALGFALLNWWADREPGFEGRTLTAWARDLNSADPLVRSNAAVAVRAMGPAAVPYLVQSLERRDPVLKRPYLWWGPKL